MKKKQKKSKKIKRYKSNNSILRYIGGVYWLLFCIMTPFFVCLIPVIPYIITTNPEWMWALSATLPIGIAIASQMWEPEFIRKYL